MHNIDDLKSIKGKVLKDYPLSKITSFRVGGKADILVLPEDEEDVSDIINISLSYNLPLVFIGNGTNLLIRDGGIRGITISLRGGLKEILIDGNYVKVGAGVFLPKLIKKLVEHGISGLEFAWGIPGTVGGAVVMNAGAFGGSLSDFIEEVTTITIDGKKKVYKRKDMEFFYRESSFQKRKEIIISALFRFNKRKARDELYKEIEKITAIRRKTQPIGKKTAGSVFKNPDGDYAGRIIESLGLKGMRIGDAMVSYVHANFIENTGSAQAKEIEELIEYIENIVEKKRGIKLSREIEILGCKD